MAGFTNSILAGDGVLVRTAIKSPNFSPGVAGWQIAKDGSVEFNNGVFRGALAAGSISAGSIGDTTIVGSDVQGGTMEETVITFDTGGGALLVYSTTTATTTYTASGTFTVPAGVTSIKAECWGAGGGGQGGSGAGGSGGEYAAELALTVTPAESLTITVGSGGAGGSGGVGGPGSNGGTTTVKRSTTALVTAHGGQGSSSSTTTGGTGSTNAVHFDGGGSHAASTGTSKGGAGGGSSAGTSSAGNSGSSNSGSTGGAGGSAVTGGGAGGAGGNGTGSGGTAGTAGSAPGGGGGTGGAGSSSNSAGGAGARGQVKITYTSAQVLIASLAPMAGTDAYGNAYPQGLAFFGTGKLLEWGAAGAAVDTNLYRSAASTLKTDDALIVASNLTPSARIIKPVARGSASTSAAGLARSTAQKVAIDTADIDTNGGFDLVNNRYVFPRVGYWRVSYSVCADSFSTPTGTPYAEAWIDLNGLGGPQYGRDVAPVPVAATTAAMSGTEIIEATATTDYVELYLRYNNSTAGTTYRQLAGAQFPTLTVEFVG